MSTSKYQNELIKSSSPYLLQHAHNPVDWHEWNNESLNLARKSNKPLLISIGYAACHWCHVMEAESFMNVEIAQFMNDNFICIKVDREERPDIDQIYMNAAQLLSGQGGWPLNAFALPNGKPFYAATYFKPQVWLNVLSQISELYKNNNQKIVEQAENLTQGIKSEKFEIKNTNLDDKISDTIFDNFTTKIKSYIDYRNGGFGAAPKFPLPIGLEAILNAYKITKDFDLLEGLNLSLKKMLNGGIYDQIGGGFARYSVDDRWFLPHFEKMLYDNAQLISLYSNAYKQTKNPDYKILVEETIEWLKREMTSSEGGFFSSLNADSENVEGKYYVWNISELEEILEKNEFDLFVEYYNISKIGNWEDGNNIPYISVDRRKFAEKKNMEVSTWTEKLNKIKKKVLEKRLQRIPPSTDDKILTSWNALTLKSLLIAYKAIGNEEFLELAERNAKFLLDNIITDDYLIFRNYKNNKASILGFLEDYAALIDAFIEFYQTTFEKKYLEIANELALSALKQFEAKNSDFFFFTSEKSEALIARKIEVMDNVIPSSNSILANSLFKLGKILSKDEFVDIAKKMLMSVKEEISDGGPYFANWAILLSNFTKKHNEVVIIGENYQEYSNDMQRNFIPNAVFIGGESEYLKLMENRLKPNETVIYVCENSSCQLPVNSTKEALDLIK